MAQVTGMTVAAINAQLDQMVTELAVTDTGQLIYTTRGGVEFNAGSIVSPSEAVESAWPIDSIFIAVVPTNPADLIGVGTWVRFGKGRFLVSQDSADTQFDAVGETGGAKTVTLDASQIPSHLHTVPAHTHSIPSHTHSMTASYHLQGTDGSGGQDRMASWTFGSSQDEVKTGNTGSGGSGNTGSSGAGNTSAVGGGLPHENLPPYVVVYMWQRTA